MTTFTSIVLGAILGALVALGIYRFVVERKYDGTIIIDMRDAATTKWILRYDGNPSPEVMEKKDRVCLKLEIEK